MTPPPVVASAPAGMIADPACRGLATRPWGLSPEAFSGLLRELRFNHFKWDTHAGGACRLLPESVVLTRELHEQIVEIVEGLHGGLARFERRVRRDPEVLRRLAIPQAIHSIIAEERHHTLQIARYDLFPTDDGRWMVSEFNEDVPGGFNEAVLPGLLGDPGPGLHWEGDLRRHFVDAFRPYDAVALLYATAFSEDLQHMLVLERWLIEEGHPTVLGSPAHLRAPWFRGGPPRVLGTAIDAAVRFYPAEWMPRLPNLRTWQRIGPDLPMMNPLHRLIRQSKTMFALWREQALIDGEDLELIDRHCPRTMAFDSAALAMLLEEKDRWVLKRAFGRMGDSVVIGALTPAKHWEAALAEAVTAPGEFSIQERFIVPPLAFEAEPLYPAIGAFVVNGRFAGYYSRAAPTPFLTHEAYHVATLVASA